MKGESKSTLTPKLRFPEFSEAGDWHSTKLGELCAITTGKKDANEGCNEGQYPFFTCAENHIFSASYSFDTEAILVAGNANVGLAKYFKGKFEAYQRTYVLMNFVGIDVPYLYAILSNHLRPDLLAQVQTSAMSYIKLPMLRDYELAIPSSPAEQRKIAACLGSLDDWIGAEGRKLEALRSHKKALMQQLFPRPGKSRPRLRFPEFHDAGEWKIKTITEIAKNLDSKRVPITENVRAKGRIPYYGASGIVDYVSDFIFEEDLLCISEDGANLVSRVYPIAFPISGKTWVNNHAHVLKFEHQCTQQFIESYLNATDLKDFITGMAQPKLNRAMLDKIPVPIPPLAEQQRIAACLSSLDDLLAAQSRKVEGLKAHKKGLMQQLFPSGEG